MGTNRVTYSAEARQAASTHGQHLVTVDALGVQYQGVVPHAQAAALLEAFNAWYKTSNAATKALAAKPGYTDPAVALRQARAAMVELKGHYQTNAVAKRAIIDCIAALDRAKGGRPGA